MIFLSRNFKIRHFCRENLNIRIRRKWFWVNSGSEKVPQFLLPCTHTCICNARVIFQHHSWVVLNFSRGPEPKYIHNNPSVISHFIVFYRKDEKFYIYCNFYENVVLRFGWEQPLNYFSFRRLLPRLFLKRVTLCSVECRKVRLR